MCIVCKYEITCNSLDLRSDSYVILLRRKMYNNIDKTFKAKHFGPVKTLFQSAH